MMDCLSKNPREFLEACTTLPGLRQLPVSLSQEMAKAVLAELATATERAEKAARERDEAQIASLRDQMKLVDCFKTIDHLKKLVEEAVPLINALDIEMDGPGLPELEIAARTIKNEALAWLTRAEEALK